MRKIPEHIRQTGRRHAKPINWKTDSQEHYNDMLRQRFENELDSDGMFSVGEVTGAIGETAAKCGKGGRAKSSRLPDDDPMITSNRELEQLRRLETDPLQRCSLSKAIYKQRR